MEVIRQVHERRLGESLASVEEALRQWREGVLPVFKIDDTIHQHMMRSKRYFALYANTPATSPEAVGILNEAMDLGLLPEQEYHELTSPRRRGP